MNHRQEVLKAAEIRRELCDERGLPPSCGCSHPQADPAEEASHRLAARAARLELQWTSSGAWVYDPDTREWEHWSPRTNDGDAARLSAACRIDVLHRVVGGCRVEALPPGGPAEVVFLAEEDLDPCRAMREAVFRAAVALGRKMQAGTR